VKFCKFNWETINAIEKFKSFDEESVTIFGLESR